MIHFCKAKCSYKEFQKGTRYEFWPVFGYMNVPFFRVWESDDSSWLLGKAKFKENFEVIK